MAPRPAVSSETLGAWLLKASPAGGAVDRLFRDGVEGAVTRCVRASYRTALVRTGQPVLLWVSGDGSALPAGLHAAGHTTGPVTEEADGPVMHVRLHRLSPIVPREALRADPVLGRIEVIRMPAGSNPSYLRTDEYAALLAAFPRVDHGDQPAEGTA